MSDIDKWLSKWNECRRSIQQLEKRMEKYKERVIKHLKGDSYTNDCFQVRKVSQIRYAIHKESVPEDIWNQYRIASHVQFYTLTQKRKKSERATDDGAGQSRASITSHERLSF